MGSLFNSIPDRVALIRAGCLFVGGLYSRIYGMI